MCMIFIIILVFHVLSIYLRLATFPSAMEKLMLFLSGHLKINQLKIRIFFYSQLWGSHELVY